MMIIDAVHEIQWDRLWSVQGLFLNLGEKTIVKELDATFSDFFQLHDRSGSVKKIEP